MIWIQLFVAVQDMAMRINSDGNMRLTGKGSGLATARRNGWTTKRTNAEALPEVICLALSNDPDWQMPDSAKRALDKLGLEIVAVPAEPPLVPSE